MANPSQQDISHIAVRFGRRLDRLPAGVHLVVVTKPEEPKSKGVDFQVFESVSDPGIASLPELPAGDYLVFYSKPADDRSAESVRVLSVDELSRVVVRSMREDDIP